MYLRDLYIEMLSHCKGTFGSWISEIINIFLHKFLEALSNVTMWRLESLFYLAFLRIFVFPYHFLARVMYDLQGVCLICRDILERALCGEDSHITPSKRFQLEGFLYCFSQDHLDFS